MERCVFLHGVSTLETREVREKEKLSAAALSLAPFEAECVDVFIRIAQFLGLPKSFGEIYGLLYTASGPINLDDCIEKLEMSKGAASQGLKQLRALGAVKLAYVTGDRRDHYVVEQNLKLLVVGFLKQRVQPGLQDLGQRIDQIEAKARALPTEQREFHAVRIGQLRSWQGKAEKLLPALNHLLVN